MKLVAQAATLLSPRVRYYLQLSSYKAYNSDCYLRVGCFGHYATRRRHDANLSRHEKGIQWLTTFDQFSSAMYYDGDFALIQYLPYTLVPFYPLFQERSGEKVERNQADWEVCDIHISWLVLWPTIICNNMIDTLAYDIDERQRRNSQDSRQVSAKCHNSTRR
jgi:hypothetical protein